MEHISKIIDGIIHEKVTPINTGIECLDKTIRGYYPGEVTTVIGEGNSCKTAFVVHQVCHIAIDQKLPTLVLLEDTCERVFLLSLIAYYCSIESEDLHDIQGSEAYKEAVAEFLGKLKESPLYIMKACWYDKQENVDLIGEFIDTMGIKILFFDEVYYRLLQDTTADFCSIGSLAIRKNIPVVVTCYIWNEREGFGITPWLKDIGSRADMHNPDVAIGFTNYEQIHIFTDEKGNNLRGMIGIEILKHRGKIKNKSYYLHRDILFYRNFKQSRLQTLQDMGPSCNSAFDMLIHELDLTIEEGKPS